MKLERPLTLDFERSLEVLYSDGRAGSLHLGILNDVTDLSRGQSCAQGSGRIPPREAKTHCR